MIQLEVAGSNQLLGKSARLASTNINLKLFKQSEIKQKGSVSCMPEMSCIKSWSENAKERDHRKDIGVDGNTLKWN